MSVLGLTLLLSGIVLGVGFFGPSLVRRATPFMVHYPRVGIALTLGVPLAWVAGVATLGAVATWLGSQHQFLSGPVGHFCQRCLAQSNPFTTTVSTGIPSIIVLASTTLLIGALVAKFLYHWLQFTRDAAAHAHEVRANSRPDVIAGHPVRVLATTELEAFSFPSRLGGIIISRGTIETLTEAELEAVLAHEHGHVTGRHHWLHTAGQALARTLPASKLCTLSRHHVESLCEIAADQAAQRACRHATWCQLLSR